MGKRLSPRAGLPFQLEWSSGRYSTVCLFEMMSPSSQHVYLRDFNSLSVAMTKFHVAIRSCVVLKLWGEQETLRRRPPSNTLLLKGSKNCQDTQKRRHIEKGYKQELESIRTSTFTQFSGELWICEKNCTFGFKVPFL